MKSDAARSVFAVLLGLAVIVPLINYYRVYPVSTLYSEVAAGVLFLGAAASSALLFAGRHSIHASLVTFVLGLTTVIGLQVAFGYYEYLMSWVTWTAYLVVFLLAASIGQWAAQDRELRRLLVDRLTHALALAALFNVFAQTAQVSGLAEVIQPLVMVPGGAHHATYRCSPSGNVAQLNHANLLAWLGICSLLYLCAVKRVRVALAAPGLAVLLLSAALTSARMAWLMAFAIAALTVGARQSLGWSQRRAATVTALVILGLLLATLSKKLLVGGSCPTSLERAFGSGQALDYWVRFELMRQALMVWWSQPVLGVGAGKFLASTFHRESNLGAEQILDFYPHNALLEVFVSFGLIGGVVLLACVAYWCCRVWNARNDSPEHWPMLAGLLVLAIHSMLEMPLWYLYFLIPFGLMLGVALGPHRVRDWSIRVPARLLLLAAAMAGVPAMVFAVIDHSRAEMTIWLSEVARESKNVSGAAVDRLAEVTGELVLFKITGEREILRFANLDPENLRRLDGANRRLMNNMPDPLTVSRQILIEAGNGDSEGARDLLRRLMAFYPKHYKELTAEIRRRAEVRPEVFGALLPVLDAELARPPKARG